MQVLPRHRLKLRTARSSGCEGMGSDGDGAYLVCAGIVAGVVCSVQEPILCQFLRVCFPAAVDFVLRAAKALPPI